MRVTMSPVSRIGAALKNVIAIAAGVVEGLGLGQNALAALITRGLVEISRLACAEGGRRDTLAGLSGLGDLVLTCTGTLSRNRHVGIELGHGRQLADVLAGMHMVAEGVRTTGAALALGARHALELPITAQMSTVLEGRVSPLEAVETLMDADSARRLTGRTRLASRGSRLDRRLACRDSIGGSRLAARDSGSGSGIRDPIATRF